MADKILSLVIKPIPLGEREVRVGASIGIAVFPVDGNDAQVLLRRAEIAMERAESTGSESYCFFAPEMLDKGKRQHNVVDDLPAAIERGELRLHFQPQVRLDDGQLRGLEALSRWQHPEHGLMLPGEFIHLAEENSAVMDAVAEWTLGAACAQFAAWRSVGLNAVRISVGAYQGFCFSPAVSAEEAERFLVPCVTAIRLAAVGDG